MGSRSVGFALARLIVVRVLLAPCSAYAADAEVEELERQVEALLQRVQELEKAREEASPAQTEGAAAARAAVPQAPAEPPGEASPVTPRGAFNDQQQAAPRPDILTLDPKYRGFIQVPNTPVLIEFNAKPRVDASYDAEQAGDDNRFITAKIPVDGDPAQGGDGVFNINAKGSRLRVDVRAPEVAGSPRFYHENDFYGSGGGWFSARCSCSPRSSRWPCSCRWPRSRLPGCRSKS